MAELSASKTERERERERERKRERERERERAKEKARKSIASLQGQCEGALNTIREAEVDCEELAKSDRHVFEQRHFMLVARGLALAAAVGSQQELQMHIDKVKAKAASAASSGDNENAIMVHLPIPLVALDKIKSVLELTAMIDKLGSAAGDELTPQALQGSFDEWLAASEPARTLLLSCSSCVAGFTSAKKAKVQWPKYNNNAHTQKLQKLICLCFYVNRKT